jgi:hypothetical protein
LKQYCKGRLCHFGLFAAPLLPEFRQDYLAERKDDRIPKAQNDGSKRVFKHQKMV